MMWTRVGWRRFWVVVGLALVAGPAAGAYLDEDEPGERAAPPDRRDGPPLAVSRLLDATVLGRPISARGLTIVPILARDLPRPEAVATLGEALKQGWITISEAPDARVEEIRVSTDAPRPVLLLAGQVLVGGKQNRLVREDVLLPARVKDLALPVLCGERGRWAGGREARFEGGGRIAPQAVRGLSMSGGSQQEVWQGIARFSAATGARSATEDVQTLTDSPEVAREVEDMAASLRCPEPARTVGLVALHEGRILGADLFGDPTLCAAYWDELVRSYARDVVAWGRRDDSDRRRRPPLPEGDAAAFLARARRARYFERPTPGLGRLYGVMGAAQGLALVGERNACLHLHLSAAEHAAPGSEPPIIRPPRPPMPEPILPYRDSP